MEIVVTGGGIGGLTAAVYLARGGAKVRLFEKAALLGGRGASQVRDGFTFNQGPHALYCGGPAEEVLAELGVGLEGRIPKASGSYAFEAGALHTLPVGFMTLLTSRLALGAKIELARFFTRLQRRRIDLAPLGGVTLDAWLEQSIRHESVRGIVRALSRVATYSSVPERVSAGAALGQIQGALLYAVRYLDGGWQSIVDGLRAAALAAGVRIDTGAPVRQIEHDGRVRAVRLADGTRVPCDGVVIAASPRVAAELSGVESLRRAAATLEPVRAACLDVALSRAPRPKAIFCLGIDRPLYFSMHSATARLAPEGAALIHVAKYKGGAPSDPEADRAELEGLLDLMQPGWREVVVDQRFLPHMTVSHALVSAEMGGLAGRPGAAVPEVAGLFVAGDWVGGKAMLADASFASAREAAQALLESAAERREVA